MFLHGFMGNSSDWKSICNSLSTDFYCVAVDLPGHGETEISEIGSPYSMEKTAELVIDLIKEKNIEGCHIVGYSMGGRLALYLAVHFSGLFNKIIIESANPGIESEIERNQRFKNDELLAKKLESEDIRKFIRYWYDQPIFNTLKRHKNFANLIESRYKINPAELAKSLRGMSAGIQTPLWDKLNQISNECLLIAGEDDLKYTHIMSRMYKKIISTKLVIIKNCGHNTHFEDSAEFTEIIRKFLRDK